MAIEKPPTLSYEDLIASGEGRLHGPGNAQLPLPPMLMFDRITHISDTGGPHGKGSVIAEFDVRPEPAPVPVPEEPDVPEGATAVRAPFVATVWQVSVEQGSAVTSGDQVLSLEAMKMETPMTAPVDGEVLEVYVKAGEQVAPGQVLMAIGDAA